MACLVHYEGNMNKIMLLVGMLSACTEAPPPGVRTCEEIYDLDTYELDIEPTQAGPLWCIADEVPHGALRYSSTDLLEPVPPGIGRFYVGPERYYPDLDGWNKVGVLVRLPDGSCAWVKCNGGINPTDAGIQ